jgi:hypothetical protein
MANGAVWQKNSQPDDQKAAQTGTRHGQPRAQMLALFAVYNAGGKRYIMPAVYIKYFC